MGVEPVHTLAADQVHITYGAMGVEAQRIPPALEKSIVPDQRERCPLCRDPT